MSFVSIRRPAFTTWRWGLPKTGEMEFSRFTEKFASTYESKNRHFLLRKAFIFIILSFFHYFYTLAPSIKRIALHFQHLFLQKQTTYLVVILFYQHFKEWVSIYSYCVREWDLAQMRASHTQCWDLRTLQFASPHVFKVHSVIAYIIQIWASISSVILHIMAHSSKLGFVYFICSSNWIFKASDETRKVGGGDYFMNTSIYHSKGV